MPVKIDPKQFQVPIGVEAGRFSLADHPTRTEQLYKSKSDYESLVQECREDLRALQDMLYAHDHYAVLLIFQGLDAAGKDGAIRHVMSGGQSTGLPGVQLQETVRGRDGSRYLWRTSKRLPRRGQIGIFNRSYYEEVLIVRVHPELLRNQRLPDEYRGPHIWDERYRDMVLFEDYLTRNGTRIIKFFLHVSRQEQRRRLLNRINRPDKNWKMTRADLESRRYWDDLQQAYGQCLRHTSHRAGPWYAVPADDKPNARLIISQIILHHMRKLPIRYPESTEKHRRESCGNTWPGQLKSPCT